MTNNIQIILHLHWIGMKLNMKMMPTKPNQPTSKNIRYPNKNTSNGPFHKSCRKANAISNFPMSFDNKLITLPLIPSMVDDFDSLSI